MAATKTELTGGSFQDSLGNPLASGYLTMRLSQDCSVSGVGTVCSGIDITVNLDTNGNVVAGQYVWSNLVMSPQNNYYKVTGFTAAGQRAFGPNNQQVASGSTFNLDSWTPNTVISWFPATQSLLLEVNGVQASSQVVQNLSAGSGVTITDEGGGVIEFASSASPVSFEVNGTPNEDQSLLNLTAGTNVTITDDGGGMIQIAAAGSSGLGGDGAFFYGPGLTNLEGLLASTSISSPTFNSTAGVVQVYLFELGTPFTVNKITQIALASQVNVHGYFGIYSFSGNLLVDGGQFLFETTSGVQTNSLGAPVTLPAGTYWHAQATDHSSTGQWVGIPIVGASANLILMHVQNATRAATAANALSGTTLPPTLGTLTPFTPSAGNSDSIMCPLYE